MEAGGGPRLIVLSAPSGEGKTRIVQEFYRELAASQTAPRYWPAQLISNDGDWKTDRKMLRVAAFRPDGGAEMPWLYWSVSCSRRSDGTLTNALTNDANQFGVHADHLFGRLDAADRGFDGVSAIIGMFSILNVVFPPLVAGVVVIDAAKYAIQNRDFVQRFWEWKKRRKEGSDGTRVVDASSHKKVSEADELATYVTKISKRLPVIVAVDDAHWADEFTIRFLNTVLTENAARVLIVATTWPEGSPSDAGVDDDVNGSNSGPFSRWLNGIGDLPTSPRVDVRAVGPLDQEDLVALARSIYDDIARDDDPALGEDVAEALARRLSTPMSVRAFFDLDMVTDQIHHGGLELRDLNDLPLTLSEIMINFWAELPENVRKVLEVAAASGEQFATAPVIAAAEQLEYAHAKGLLEQGKTPYGVTRGLTGSLESFTDVLFYQRAHAERLSPRKLKIIYDAIAEYATSLDVTTVPVALASNVLSTHVALAENDRNRLIDRGLAAASAWKLAKLSADTYSFFDSIRYARKSLDWSDPSRDQREVMEIRGNLAKWTARVGQTTQAITMLQSLLDDRTNVLGPNDPDTLATRHNLAACFGQTGHVSQAIEMLRSLLDDRTKELGRDHPDTLATKDSLAAWLGQAGQVTEAIEMNRALLEDRKRVLGPDDADTFATRNHLAYYLAESGQFTEAIEMNRALLEDRKRVLGPDAPNTLVTSHNLAYSLGKAGHLSESIDMFRTLVDDRTRVLGAGYPDTLAARYNLAHSLALAGRDAEAIAMYRVLLEDQDHSRALDPDDPLLAKTRDALAELEGQQK